MAVDYDIDLFDPEQSQHMWADMDAMRSACPVAKLRGDIYYTTSYQDTYRAFRDVKSFSCLGGFRAPGVEIPEEELQVAEIDAPAHTRIRKFLLRSFNPSSADAAEPFTRRFVCGLLDELDARGGGDLVGDFAVRVPLAVTGHVLGVEQDVIPNLGRWMFDFAHTDWPAYGVTDRDDPSKGEGLDAAAPEMASYFDELIARAHHAPEPSRGLISELVQAEIDGDRLSDHRIKTLAINVLSAGLSTTNLLSNLTYRLVTDLELRSRIEADRSLLPAAIEESLRMEPPVLFLFRTAKEDVELSGTEISRGDRVAMGIAAANRDGSRFEAPSEFRLDRGNGDEHLSFGAGSHLCLGNHLARMEAKVVIGELLDRYGPEDMTLAPDFTYELMPHFLEYGPGHLEVVISGRR